MGMGLPSWAWHSGLGWGWGWFAAVGGILAVGIFLIPWFFFLLNLQNTLNRVSDANRAMPSGHVWLNFIPIFNLGWFIYTVAKVRDSLRDEYRSRNWAPAGDFGYNVGLATGVLAIVSFFLGWVPMIGWAVGLAQLVCWILYWLKIHELKNTLGEWTSSPPNGTLGPGYHSPYSQPYVPPPYTGSPGQPGRPQGGPGGGYPYPPPPAPAPPATAPPVMPPPVIPVGPAGSAAPPSSDEGGESDETGERRICAGCGASYDLKDEYCRRCGLKLPQAPK